MTPDDYLKLGVVIFLGFLFPRLMKAILFTIIVVFIHQDAGKLRAFKLGDESVQFVM